ncbi:MAG: substrate-binding domain-containing protein [Wenzhouxiangellaceae bacterium]|nr:substrate-binding domain-containing protein [Wenzhouxiangellaceae bacterium]
MKVELDIHWRIGLNEARAVDPLLFRLLEAIERGDNLREATRSAGVSYRHAWGLLQQWQDELGVELVELQRGRGARMLPLGQALLGAARHARGRLAPTLASLAAELEHDLIRLTDQDQPVRISASHDSALRLLVDHLNVDAPPRFNLQHRGSLESLRQLAGERCELAGFHLPEDPPQPAIGARFRPLVPSGAFELLHFVRRRQGLILPPGNPRAVRSLADLAAQHVPFINRQPGSGTRLLFDALLTRAEIAPDAIEGYAREEYTHQAVAAMVASGRAEAGFGIAHAAADFGLDFVPLASERYLLAFPRRLADSGWVQRLRAALDDAGHDPRLTGMPGYDFTDCGQPAGIEAR